MISLNTQKKRKIHFFLLLIIFFLGGFFRFYNYSNRISMGADSNRDAFVAIYGAEKLQFPLTGPFISITPATTGPWYWYQLIFSRIIFPFELMPWLYLGLISLLLVLIMYRIGVLLESKGFGLILALIVSLSPQQIGTAYQLTNPSIIGTFSSLVLLIFLEIILKKRNIYWGLLLGFILGVTINSHYQSAPLGLFIPFLLVLKKKKEFIYSLIGLIITFIPILLFELNNHWFNTVHIIDYLRFGQYRIWTSMRWLIYVFDFWPKFWIFVIGGSKIFGLIIMFASSLIVFKNLLTNQKKKILFLICMSFIIEVVIIRYYRGERFFGYLQFFHPYIFLFTGYVLYAFYRKKLVFGFIATILYLYLVIPSSIKVLQADTLTVEISSVYNKVISEWGNKEYAIYDCSSTDINRGRGLSLFFVLRGNYNPNSNNKLLYFYGHCSLPNFVKENKTINPDLYKQQDLFPRIDIFYDVSAASEAAILEKGGVKFTTSNEYNRAAKWWFDEKP